MDYDENDNCLNTIHRYNQLRNRLRDVGYEVELVSDGYSVGNVTVVSLGGLEVLADWLETQEDDG